MPIIKGGNVRKGSYILFRGEPHLVSKTEFVSPGKGSAFTRARLKHMKTGAALDFTFKSTESVEELEMETRLMQFLYAEDQEGVFMDPHTYEQVTLSKDLLDDALHYLISEAQVYVMFYEEKAIGIRLPLKVTLEVIEAEDVVAGNRVNAPKKPVKLETGLTVHAPLFVNVGDKLIVDTQTGEYVSRA